MIQTIIICANFVSPIIISLIILYVSIGWILIYFKKETLVNKYFTNDNDVRISSLVYSILLVIVMIIQALSKLNPDELSPLGFSLLFYIVSYVVSSIVKGLIKYRNSITPQ